MRNTILSVGALAIVLSACGSDGSAVDADVGDNRTIEIAMTDMAYTPTRLEVASGETVTLTFRNDGTVRHEALFGDTTTQLAHRDDMADSSGEHEMSDMDETADSEGDHDMGDMVESDLDVVVLEPGQTVTIIHTFPEAGETMIGCHEPGHWEAGMRLNIVVT